MEKIGIIGLGYVGLPLALEFGKIIPEKKLLFIKEIAHMRDF
jgi:hypothetical protein